MPVPQEEFENTMANCPPKGPRIRFVWKVEVVFAPVYPTAGLQSFYSGGG
jgi:hypothetical protein